MHKGSTVVVWWGEAIIVGLALVGLFNADAEGVVAVSIAKH
jgi:hypothetical protein